ncbi:hypothetical protein SAMN05518672_109173 [Chitinophaga sp. CF118]|uniref:hypothetical protein n=1 Tax=Chitinophaga sp. CF118 TaxID=1884367 RepID=UPI0008E842B1|nr:hypothetical protein [Chitinophaga sp. CF118]SFE71880.1 hypothetical protein SAMN05518672_109173 [Chitinophaga sp. CF118]
MKLHHYIESGIIESYALGLATMSEIEELQHMRKLYPELNTEIRMVERRLEMVALTEGVMLPVRLKDRIFQRIDWEQQDRNTEKGNPSLTFINIESKNRDYITVHKWWKLFFIMTFIVSKVCLFAAIYFYLKYQQSKEKKTPHVEQHIPVK